MIQSLTAVDKVLLSTQTLTAAATASATAALTGADWATIRINFAAEVNTDAVGPTVSVLTSDGTTYATIVADRTEDLTAAHELRYEIDCKSAKKNVKLSITAATHTTNDNVTCGAILTLHRNAQEPASTTAMQASTNDAVVIV